MNLVEKDEFLIEKAKQAKKLCELGATDKDLAEFFEVGVTTIGKWRAKYDLFARALKTGKELADERVERALYTRAVGYDYETEKAFNDKGNIVKTTVAEHIPPDVNAAQFWLKNRRRETWRDKQEAHVDGKIEIEWVK